MKRGVPASSVRVLGANILKERAFRRAAENKGANPQKRPPKVCCLNSEQNCINAKTH